jgi:hypothetical protein
VILPIPIDQPNLRIQEMGQEQMKSKYANDYLTYSVFVKRKSNPDENVFTSSAKKQNECSSRLSPSARICSRGRSTVAQSRTFVAALALHSGHIIAALLFHDHLHLRGQL